MLTANYKFHFTLTINSLCTRTILPLNLFPTYSISLALHVQITTSCAFSTTAECDKITFVAICFMNATSGTQIHVDDPKPSCPSKPTKERLAANLTAKGQKRRKCSGTGNRTRSFAVKARYVDRYTIPDVLVDSVRIQSTKSPVIGRR